MTKFKVQRCLLQTQEENVIFSLHLRTGRLVVCRLQVRSVYSLFTLTKERWSGVDAVALAPPFAPVTNGFHNNLSRSTALNVKTKFTKET